MRIVAKTDIGNMRSENQDNYRAGEHKNGLIWALVCDGMGGAQGGRLASALACEYMERAFTENLNNLNTNSEIKKFLFDVASDANKIIFSHAQKDENLKGMGTTLVCAIIKDNNVQCVHAGDSRAYIYSKATLNQITKDHSMVQELVEQNRISQREAYFHPNKNLITRALGVNDYVDLEHSEHTMQSDDVLLLCTDGLTNSVKDELITKIIAKTPFEQMADALVESALEREGFDNITVLLCAAQQINPEGNA